MKQTIHGKEYDSEKSSRIGSAVHLSTELSKCWHASVYLGENGYFLAGVGGRRTDFAAHPITPMSRSVALCWVAAHCSARAFFKHFKRG